MIANSPPMASINTESGPETPPRINNLTAARFFAALLVVFHHIPMLQNPEIVETEWLRKFFYNGYTGVTFFFILSGFVISYAHFSEFEKLRPKEISIYFYKRIARIAPLWLFLSIPFIIRAYATDINYSFYKFISFTQAWDANPNVAFGYLSVAWTLSCEFFFYAMFPFIAFSIHKLTNIWKHSPITIAALSAIVSLAAALLFQYHPDLSTLPLRDPNSAHRWLYRFPAMRLLEFIAGVCLFVWIAKHRSSLSAKDKKPAWIILLLASIVSLLVLMSITTASPLTYTAAYIIPFSLLVLALAGIEINASPASVKATWALLLGESSYALYLVHKDFGILKNYLQPMAPASSIVWSIFFAVVISVGLYSCIERPSRRFIIGFLPKLGRRSHSTESELPHSAQTS